MKKRVNSRDKGVRGELVFAKHLRELGFTARRGQQHAGGPESPDVVTSLDNIHFEVKFGYPKSVLDIGTKQMLEALWQAREEAHLGAAQVVAWKPRGTRRWRYTFFDQTRDGICTTVCSTLDREEADFLKNLNSKD